MFNKNETECNLFQKHLIIQYLILIPTLTKIYFMVKILILIAFLLTATFCTSFFNLAKMPTNNGARCMDGSQYGIYVCEPDKDDVPFIANRMIIVFQDYPPAGWCFQTNTSASIEECAHVMESDFGSSKGWSNTEYFWSGILSFNGGGFFYNWIKVFIPSCDGGAFLGNSDPVSFKKDKIYFRGSQNVKEAFAYLDQYWKLRSREEIVIVGSYNSAIAAMMWTQHLQSLTSVPIRIIADAAIFQNTHNHKHNQMVLQERLEQVTKFTLQNVTIPNTACAAANQAEPWKCFFASELVKYVDVPIFFMQSFYDGHNIEQIVGFKCTEEFGSLQECTKEEREVIHQYYLNTSRDLNDALQRNEKSSAFAIACVAHEFLNTRWNNPQFEVPEASGHRPITVTSNWASGITNERFIDKVEWPHNQPCSRKVKQSPPAWKQMHLNTE